MPVNSFDDYPMAWKPKKEKLQPPYYLSIAAKLEEDILSGRLSGDTRLPPQRELADFLDLNLSTITRAYKLCELKGLVYAVTGSGTFVAPGVLTGDTFLAEGADVVPSISRRGESPVVIEMGMIQPFYENNGLVLQAAQNVLARPDAARLLEYSAPLGTKGQLEAARKWLGLWGVHVQTGNILLAAGAQNALAVVLMSLFQAGDKIAVDSFTYTNFKGLANFLQIQLVAVEGDFQGMCPDMLEQACRQLKVKGVYLMPTCSNPTAVYMPDGRRREIVKIVRKYSLLLIEDDIYSFLGRGKGKRETAVSLYTCAPEQTVHICSISKSLCAGLRVAFLAFPERYRRKLVEGMLHTNLKTVSLNGEIVAELIHTGAAERMAEEKIRLARGRNRIFRHYFGREGTDAHGIERFFHWLSVPEDMDSRELEVEALRRGIRVLGSHRFAMRDSRDCRYVRVAVTSPATEGELARGLAILKGLLREPGVTYFV